MNLYEIDQALIAEFWALENCEETGETPESIHERIESLKVDREIKLASTAAYIKNLRSDLESVEAEIERLSQTEILLEGKIEAGERFLRLAVGDKPWSNGIHSVTFRKTPGELIIPDETKVPTCYLEEKTTYVPKKKEIRQAIQEKAKIEFAYIKPETRMYLK